MRSSSEKAFGIYKYAGGMKMEYLCLDVGGTSIKYSLCDAEGNETLYGKIPTGKSLNEFLEQVENLYQKVCPIAGVAACFPGEVHSQEGVIKGISAVEHLHNQPIKQMISEICGKCKVTMLNDANAAALGELWQGTGRNHKNIAFVIVGSGIGGAVIENGGFYPGSTCNKAEIGNFLMGGMQDGRLLTWSDFTLEKQARKYCGISKERISGKELIARARQGETLAGDLVSEFLYYMAVGCVYVQFAYDPEIIAIGGGISQDPQIIEDIREAYRKLISGQRMGYLMPHIEACQCRSKANLFGSLYFHLKN